MDACAAALERYLLSRIPVCAALGVHVAQAGPECVRLTAPLATNVNHSGTVFGGSAAAVATLAAWSLLHLRLEAAGLRARTMIQRNAMEYERPIVGDFEAACHLTDGPAWERFVALLQRRGRARLHLEAQLRCGGESVGHFAGEFVALGAAFGAPDPPETPA